MIAGPPSSGSLRGEPDEAIVARARAQADAEARAAIISARIELANAPEYWSYIAGDGKKHNIPIRAMAAGMLEFLEAAYHRANPDKDPI